MKLTQKNLDFLDDLFDKLLKNTDKDMIDLHDSDSCDDHVELEKISTDESTDVQTQH
tara:strand:+ start:480 stop:650 length:171 start_codon:yes stop_codon:yes gene_type:complete